MEACAGAHYWGRLLRSYGHDVRLITPSCPALREVRQERRSGCRGHLRSGTTAHDALCSRRRSSSRNSVDPSDAQPRRGAAHSADQPDRGLVLEYGIEIPTGRFNLLKRLPEILEDAENGLTEFFRKGLSGLYEELRHLDARIEHYDEKLKQIAQADERLQRLQTIPGIGPVIATALLAAIGDIQAFKTVASWRLARAGAKADPQEVKRPSWGSANEAMFTCANSSSMGPVLCCAGQIEKPIAQAAGRLRSRCAAIRISPSWRWQTRW